MGALRAASSWRHTREGAPEVHRSWGEATRRCYAVRGWAQACARTGALRGAAAAGNKVGAGLPSGGAGAGSAGTCSRVLYLARRCVLPLLLLLLMLMLLMLLL